MDNQKDHGQEQDHRQEDHRKAGRPRPGTRLRARATMTAALVGLAFIAVACSSDPSGPGVAGAGSATTTTAPSGQGSSTGGPDASKLLAYSKCMQSHGVTDFPDPNGSGRLAISSGPGGDLNPHNPTFRAAQQACQHLMPTPTPAQKAQALKDGLKMAGCMRAHGIKDFPDPNSSGAISIGSGQGSDLNPNNPQFQAAQTACQHILGLPQGGQRIQSGSPGNGKGGPGGGSGFVTGP